MKCWSGVLAVCLLLGACSREPSRPASDLPIADTATIRDIMADHVDPAGDFVFQSVQEIADEQGVRRKQPRTESEWNDVKASFKVLHEAPGFMIMKGRKAARPDQGAKFPEVELETDEINKLLETEHDDFVERARVLEAAAARGLQAAETKDADALAKVLPDIDVACESCHLHFWYPKDARARASARLRGIRE